MSVQPVQPENRFYMRPIESKVHGGFVFLSLILAIGTLLGGLGLYGCEDLTFQAGMFTGLGLSLLAVAILLYRRYTHMTRLIEQTLNKIERYEVGGADNSIQFQDFSYLFSIFIAQGKGNNTDPEKPWSIVLSPRADTFFAALVKVAQSQGDSSIRGIINIRERSTVSTYSMDWTFPTGEGSRQDFEVNI